MKEMKGFMGVLHDSIHSLSTCMCLEMFFGCVRVRFINCENDHLDLNACGDTSKSLFRGRSGPGFPLPLSLTRTITPNKQVVKFINFVAISTAACRTHALVNEPDFLSPFPRCHCMLLEIV